MKRVLMFSILAGLAPASLALETISVANLQSQCASHDKTQKAMCEAYISGFLDGALTTDPRVVENVVSEIGKSETFSERAMRTRLGRQIDRYGPSYYADFCFPSDDPVSKLIDLVNNTPESPGDDSAREHIYSVLKDNFECLAKN